MISKLSTVRTSCDKTCEIFARDEVHLGEKDCWFVDVQSNELQLSAYESLCKKAAILAGFL